MPVDQGGKIAIREKQYGTTFFTAEEPVPPPTVTVRLLAAVPKHDQNATILVIGLTIGFLALAFVFAVIVSRTLIQSVVNY